MSRQKRGSYEPGTRQMLPTVQYSIFRPSWMLRGPLAPVTAPNPQANEPLHPGLPAGMNGEVIGVAHAPPLAW